MAKLPRFGSRYDFERAQPFLSILATWKSQKFLKPTSAPRFAFLITVTMDTHNAPILFAYLTALQLFNIIW